MTGQFYDALTSDLRTEKAYTLANNTTPLTGPGVVTALLEISDTGALTGNSIQLSAGISLGYYSGIFAGYGRVLLYDGSSDLMYNVDLPSGRVTQLGYVYFNQRTSSENWSYSAFWGVAEYFRGDFYVLYGLDSGNIGRTRVRDGKVTFVSTRS